MEDEERMQWVGRFEFLFTSLGYTIGLGNIWRFPHACYINGGGAFLIPYLLTVIFCTVPTLFLEMCLGQFCSQSAITAWKISPLFSGVGWAMMFNVFITVIYYIVIVMYAFYYMLVSFVSIGGSSPWEDCQDDWKTDVCRKEPFVGGNSTIQNQRPEEQYWWRFVLVAHESDGLNNLGPLVGRNVVLLLVVWLIVYYCCIRGIRSIAKVVYVTATVPFVMLLILLVRGLTLPGYEIGIKYYTEADWGKLADIKIWASAATQAMYSLGVGFGTYIALASHNKFTHNIFRDAVIVGTVNTVTSIFSGFVVFAFLGHLSKESNIPIEKAFDQGPGILFISYVQGISLLPGSAFWAFFFFLNVVLLGLDSQMVMNWTIFCCFEDQFPDIYKRFGKWILIGMCIVAFILGLPMVTNGGIHMLILVESYTANFSLTLFVIIETVAVCWVYGINHFVADIEMMLGNRPKVVWWCLGALWMVTCPGFYTFILIASMIRYEAPSYAGKRVPAWGEAIGWMLILTPFIICIVCAIVEIRKKGSVWLALRPCDTWGPGRRIDRWGRYGVDAQYIRPISRSDRPDGDSVGGQDNVTHEAECQNEAVDVGPPPSPCYTIPVPKQHDNPLFSRVVADSMV